jgi:hypothetical protein
MSSPLLAALIGLIAPALFLYAYFQVSHGRWQSTQMRFHLLNLLGALAILVSLIAQWNLPICILECCWASISLYGIVKALRAKPA